MLQVIFYTYALIGIEIFHDAIPVPKNGSAPVPYVCGTYEQLDYWANNFNDFAVSIASVVLFCSLSAGRNLFFR